MLAVLSSHICAALRSPCRWLAGPSDASIHSVCCPNSFSDRVKPTRRCKPAGATRLATVDYLVLSHPAVWLVSLQRHGGSLRSVCCALSAPPALKVRSGLRPRCCWPASPALDCTCSASRPPNGASLNCAAAAASAAAACLHCPSLHVAQAPPPSHTSPALTMAGGVGDVPSSIVTEDLTGTCWRDDMWLGAFGLHHGNVVRGERSGVSAEVRLHAA